jgi:hypothetical protein
MAFCFAHLTRSCAVWASTTGIRGRSLEFYEHATTVPQLPMMLQEQTKGEMISVPETPGLESEQEECYIAHRDDGPPFMVT